jgi:hypothetical protein
MLNDFLPAIIAIAILAAAFLYAWISDIRRIGATGCLTH